MEKLTIGTRALPPLAVGDSVLVQNQIGNHPSKWDITGVIVERKDFDQYVVKVDGSGRLTMRNRKFLRKITPYQLTKHFPDSSLRSATSDPPVVVTSPPPTPSTPVSLTAGLRGEGASLSMPGPKPSGGQCYWSRVVE